MRRTIDRRAFAARGLQSGGSVTEQLPIDDRIVHFGPVYGRPTGASMALCDNVLPPAGTSRTMSRSLKMVTCEKCDQAIQDMVNENPPVRREDIT